MERHAAVVILRRECAGGAGFGGGVVLRGGQVPTLHLWVAPTRLSASFFSLGCVVRCEYIDGACRLCWADPNATAGQSIDSIDISLPLLNTLISVASNRSTPQADRVHDVSFIGFELSQVQFAIV
eukprot:COSAG04_NODE_2578_length_3902_cov_3.615830_2_plen_125_part_00